MPTEKAGASPTGRKQSLAARRPRSRGRTWLFRAAAVLLGLSAFAVAEGVCRVFDWGRPTRYDDPFVGFSEIHPLFELDETGTEYRIPESRLKFFAPESFAANKGERTFRIFCLGGSTVQGRPYSKETSFTTWLELGLHHADPRFEWEVINCGGISYASYRLVPILEECLRYEPDLFIICTGHNEFLEDRSYEHIKGASPLISGPLRFASRLRTFALLREAVSRLTGQGPEPEAKGRPVLAAETDPMLDYNDSLKAYSRDDAWQEGVVEHFEFNLRRMVDLAHEADVPAILVIEPSNLGDCPPFKSEHSDDLTATDRVEWERLMKRARDAYRGDLQKSVALLKKAAEINPRHAATWYELGKTYQALGLHAQARDALWRARDKDVCPLRMPSTLEETLREVAEDEGVPLIDSHELLEARCHDGILDNTMLVDHVHPTFEGHQLIADELVETMAEQGWARLQPGWQRSAQAEYQRHLDSLDSFYFLKGQRTIEAVRGWAQGRAAGLPAAGRFPERTRGQGD